MKKNLKDLEIETLKMQIKSQEDHIKALKNKIVQLQDFKIEDEYQIRDSHFWGV